MYYTQVLITLPKPEVIPETVDMDAPFREPLAKLVTHITDRKEIKKVSKDENLLIIAGEEDPVGRFGKGPRELHWMYQKLGVKKVKLKMFDHMRHEIHNETGKEAVWSLISKFLLA